MKILLVSLLLSLNAFASDNGREEAYGLCQSLSFQSDIVACVRYVNSVAYFQPDLVPFCSSFNFNREKVDCLKVIANKVYTSIESKMCKEMTFTSQQIKCFMDLGLPYYLVPMVEISSAIDLARYHLKLGKVTDADLVLEKLQRRLSGLP